MKARTVASKKDIDRVNEAVWKLTLESIIDGNAVMMIAVKRFFGLGPKRLSAFMNEFDKVKAEFDVYDKDGVFKEKIREELEASGVDVDEMYTVNETFEEVYKKQKRQDKPQLSLAEAAKVKRNLDQFRAFMNDNGKKVI